jgi:zinc transport system substrate-binding protein
MEHTMKGKQSLIVIICIVMLCVLVSCKQKQQQERGEKKMRVVASLFPLYDFARQIGKEKAGVVLLVPPGAEPHSFEPRPGDILKIHEADMFLYTGEAMEPWIEEILKGINKQTPIVVDSGKEIMMTGEHADKGSAGHEHGKDDPHIWLDFSNAEKMVDAILDGFVRADPSHRAFYMKNAEAYKQQLQSLDKKYFDSLASCKKRILIHGGHFAFGYLARRYNLQYLTAYQGYAPNAEPTPQNLIELMKKLRSNSLRFVFYEELVMPRLAETIARETGAGLLMLNGAHNVTEEELEKGVTFISLMEQNLENLKRGLECQGL